MNRAVDSRTLQAIGRALKRWREQEPSISMEALALRINRSLSTVQRWERGAMEPKASDLQQMAKVKPGLITALFRRRRPRRRVRQLKNAA